MSVPPSLPLDNGKLSCQTCHLPGTAQNHLRDTAPPAMLRSPGPGPLFCAQCHDQAPRKRSAAHAGAVGRAHLRWAKGSDLGHAPSSNAFSSWDLADRSSGLASRRRGSLDAVSLACLGCHDGTAGPRIGQSHPVGVEMGGSNQNRPARRRLARPQELDRRITLFDKRVSCASCHNPYSDDRQLLVIPNDQGQLCRQCHIGY
ncbi:MAG: hypothetical protein IT443_11490 [Phycisphaeraceae bacterium]|nr:hypothetical protein [Phycisphaeraceae bacterium]